LSDGDRDGLGDFLLDGLHLLDHPNGASLNGLQHVLEYGFHFLLFDLHDLLNILNSDLHLDLLDHFRLFDKLGPWLLHLLPLHDDLSRLLKFFPENGLLSLNRLGFVLNSALILLLLLEHNSLDRFRHGSDHLLLSGDRLHLPLGALSRSVLVLVVDVAVLMAMELIGDVADFAATTGTQLAAGAGRDLAPEGTGLMVTTATAPSGATALLALASRVLHPSVAHVEPRERAVLELVGLVGLRPSTPAILVLAADAAHQGVTRLQHEGRLLELTDVSRPLLKGAGNVWQASENAVRCNTLHFITADRGA